MADGSSATAAFRIERVAAVEDAGGDALTFATNEAYLTAAFSGGAAAVLVEGVLATEAPAKPLLVVENVRHALAEVLRALQRPRPRGPFRHPSAVVAEDAVLAGDVYVDANAYVGSRAAIGPGSIIGAGAHVGEDAVVGESAWIHPGARLMAGCRIGDRVVLHPGCTIGSDGFGWIFIDGRTERIPQVGNVILEDDVEIGSNTCVDRAQTGSTHVGTGTKIDNLVQIGHNCRIGKHCVIASQTGLAGTTVLGDYVKVAGQAGFRGHITVGSRVTIGGRAGVRGDVPDGATISGNPAIEYRDDLRREVMIRRLPKLFDRVEALERSPSRSRQGE